MKKPDYEDWHAQGSYEMDYVGDIELGLNFRLSEVQCAMGVVQLGKLAGLNKTRINIGRYLNKHLDKIDGISVQKETPGVSHLYHLYTFFFDQEKIGASKYDFIKILQEEKKIQISLRYFPVHLLSQYRMLGHKFGECPVAEKVFFEQQVNLPIYPSLTQKQVDYMIEAVKSAVKKLKAK
jgi:perosamine synthetase